MSQLKIPDLFERTNQKNLRRLEIFDSVLVKCHKRIKYNSDLERTYCFYQIPEFIIGVPLYNIYEMRKYIINSLKNNGFQIMYIDPNWLFISWGQQGVKKLMNTTLQKEKKEKEKSKYKSIDTYKPSGNLMNDIYGESAMLGLSNKFD